jgi:hypothetical protein
MWCIPKVDTLFKERMEDVLEVYERPYNKEEPVVCLDEKSKQLLEDRRPSLPAEPAKALRRDYEYKRNGTRNLFVAVEPKGGHREVTVTKRRQKKDFAYVIKALAEKTYKKAKQIHVVLDNLNTHFESSLYETFGKKITKQLMKRIVFHYTPCHASWLNMAEIEIGILSRQCIIGRIGTEQELLQQVQAWHKEAQQQESKNQMEIY